VPADWCQGLRERPSLRAVTLSVRTASYLRPHGIGFLCLARSIPSHTVCKGVTFLRVVSDEDCASGDGIVSEHGDVVVVRGADAESSYVCR